MNIQILDSWLREYLDTTATKEDLKEKLSLTSVSIERMNSFGKDIQYDIEVTTNRPDLMSVIGLAREASAVLPQFDIPAKFLQPTFKKPNAPTQKLPFEVTNDPKLINRICAVVLEVTIGKSRDYIKNRLEAAGIRSLNNVVDITNYVMREVGHPVHAFDYDRLITKKLVIRESKKGEKITTLDGKTYTLPGGDIVADNGQGEIEDLIGIMGLENSVVTDNTKRIVLFLDNNEAHHIRKTSMNLGIRTEAAVLNEKGVDPELAMTALLRGIELYEKIADGKVVSEIIDIYPNKPKLPQVTITQEKINAVIGIELPQKQSEKILTSLGFGVSSNASILTVQVPSFRALDVSIPEDIVEEVARVYGYHRLPSILPPISYATPYHIAQNEFYWEARLKNALKYWGFTEVYTYSFVSENYYEGPLEDAVTLANPLNEDMVYMRRTLVPSILQAVADNKVRDELRIFEVANVYHKRDNNLPEEIQMLAGVVKKEKLTFYEVKGILEQLFNDLGIEKVSYKQLERGGDGADISIGKEYAGYIEVLGKNLINFELSMPVLLKNVSMKKIYKPVAKFPPIIEDFRFQLPQSVTFEEVVKLIKEQDKLIVDVSLLDVYQDKKTFRVSYQDPTKNLAVGNVVKIREKIIEAVEEKLQGKIA
jgi:phenylalanyl-tRNA synthetase beta chain